MQVRAFERYIHLTNEFNFCNVHGIVNTSGLLQSKWSPTFYYNIKYIESINKLGKKQFCI